MKPLRKRDQRAREALVPKLQLKPELAGTPSQYIRCAEIASEPASEECTSAHVEQDRRAIDVAHIAKPDFSGISQLDPHPSGVVDPRFHADTAFVRVHGACPMPHQAGFRKKQARLLL